MTTRCDCHCHESTSVIMHDRDCCEHSCARRCAITYCRTPWDEVVTSIIVKLPPGGEEHRLNVCKSHASELKPAASGYSLNSYAVSTKGG